MNRVLVEFLRNTSRALTPPSIQTTTAHLRSMFLPRFTWEVREPPIPHCTRPVRGRCRLAPLVPCINGIFHGNWHADSGMAVGMDVARWMGPEGATCHSKMKVLADSKLRQFFMQSSGSAARHVPPAHLSVLSARSAEAMARLHLGTWRVWGLKRLRPGRIGFQSV